MPHVQVAHHSRSRVGCLLRLTAILFVASAALAQAQQNRYLAYATYADPDVNAQLSDGPALIAANDNGQVCAATIYLLMVVNADGTLGYSDTFTSLSVFNFDRPVISAIAIDGAGNCYMAGRGTVIPTPGAYQSKKAASIFLVKFDPHGNTVFAALLGGSNSDYAEGIVLDPNGNLWVSGLTTSNDFPVTSNAIQSSFQGGPNDAFIAELNPSGSQLLYGTYLGGSHTDGPAWIGVDASGNVVVAGRTNSTNFPVLNALQPTLEASYDAFVTKLSNAGHLLFSTYLGQTSNAEPSGLAVAPTGEAFVTGSAGPGFPLVNPLANQTGEVFIAKLSADGSALVYSTYFGFQYDTRANGIQVDTAGNAAIVGTGSVSELNPIETAADGFLTTLDPNGNLLFSSPVGSVQDPFQDTGVITSAGVDAIGNIYLGGATGIYEGFPLLHPINGTYTPFFGCPQGTCSYIEPFIAKVALGTGASFAMPAQAQFTNAVVGASQGPVSVTLFNTGTTDIGINSITTTGDFSVVQNQCPATLTQALDCQVSVNFVPTAGGTRNGTIVIADDSPGNPHIIQLTGTGLAPGASVTPNSLAFSDQGLNTISPAQKVTLTNSGTATLSISQIAISGTNAADFTETNGCGLSLGAGLSCTISVTFTPTAVGSRTATLSITDDVGTQMVALSGTGVLTLGLGIPSGGSNLATVAAGSTAKYTLSIGGGGMSGTATLTCTGTPTGATCTVPDSVNVSDTQASPFTVSVSTTARSSAALQRRRSSFLWAWALALVGIVWFPVSHRFWRLVRTSTAISSLLLLTLLVSCGGGSSGTGGGGGTGGTPAGTYTLTVAATMNGSSQSQKLTLTVQ